MRSNTYERTRHATEEIPYSHYKCKIPEGFLSVSPHWHREFEINYMLKGSGVFRIDDKEYYAEAGDIVFIQPEKLHSVYSDVGLQIYDTLVFSADMLCSGRDRVYKEYVSQLEEGAMEIAPIITKDNPHYKEFQLCAEKIFSNSTKSALGDIMVRSQLLEMIYLLISNGFITAKDVQVGPKKLKPILKYIDEHYNEELTVRDLAGLSHLSESYFMAQFRNQTGMSAIEYVNRLRIEKAQNMLRESNMSVMSIALDCGYKNISNFNRSFKKITGTTPLAYRKDAK